MALWALLLLLAAGYARPTAAQETGLSVPFPNFFNSFNCFPIGFPVRQRAVAAGPGGGNPTSRLSEYGAALTPRGSLRVLVIYAGFTNDNVPRNQGRQNAPYNHDTEPNNPWPQTLNCSTWGESLPRSAATDFYPDSTFFSTTARDQSLSDFY
jgi:hypothetical protein